MHLSTITEVEGRLIEMNGPLATVTIADTPHNTNTDCPFPNYCASRTTPNTQFGFESD